MKKYIITIMLLVTFLINFCTLAQEPQVKDVIKQGIPEPLYSVSASTLHKEIFKDPIGYWNSVDEANEKAMLIYPDGSGRTYCPVYTYEFIDQAPFNIRQCVYEYNPTTDTFLTYPYADDECSIKYTNTENLKLFIYPEQLKKFLLEIGLDNPEDIRVIRQSKFFHGYILYIVKNNACYFVPLLNTDKEYEFENRKKYTLEEFSAKFEKTSAKLNVLSNEVACDVPPFIQYGNGVVPLRATLEAMGVEVLWIEESNTIRFDCFEVQLNLLTEPLEYQAEINEVGYIDALNKLDENGEITEEYDIGYAVINGRTFVEPESLMAAIGEHYGIKVRVDRNDYSINIERENDNTDS